METVNFTQFDLRTPLLTSDYIVGYKADGSTEYRATVKQIVDLVQNSDSQTLSFNEASKNLSITSGNTVSLSSLSDTAFAEASGSFATNTLLQSNSALLTPLTLTNTLTSQLVLNTNFNSYKTNVAAATATLLPITIYQNASGSFATNTLLQSTSALLTPLTLTNTLTGQLVLNTDFNSYKTNVAAATATLLPITIYQNASGSFATNTLLQSTSALLTPLTLTNTLTGQINSSIIPTVTNYLSTNNVQISSLNITDSLNTSVRVTDFATSKTFLSSDTSKVFHFNTTTQSLCAIFPNTLPNGFNVAVMNTGTNSLVLSASQLNSIGNVLSVQYGGAFVYKDNNQLFAVGRL